ncbi:Uncharacterised protein [Mycobacterium tuberculosis]|nr:Uncharacterised protein [Mycobacterium tuberculosis]
MITHDLPLDELPSMFQRYADRSEVAAKVIFRP